MTKPICIIYFPVSEDGDFILPTQAAGVYFGWAEVVVDSISKVVIGIGYESGPSTMRKLVRNS